MTVWLKVRAAGKSLIEHEPALIFNLAGLAVSVAAKYGLSLDVSQVIVVVGVVFGTATLATRSQVWSPAGHYAEVESVASMAAAVGALKATKSQAEGTPDDGPLVT